MIESESPSASPSEGLGVLHLFLKPTPLAEPEAILKAVTTATESGTQVVTIAILGHKADLAIMALDSDLWALRRLQSALGGAGLDVIDSYLSITEVSEYAAGIPEEMRQVRLYPELPPEGMYAWCFYPMSKRRSGDDNWYRAPFERRRDMMHEHGESGRNFAGRVVQLVTASTGLDDYEWGVTLFAQRPDDIKQVVYTLRFDEGSAVFGEFGSFYTGMVASPELVLDAVGLAH
jgi:chlorite dismutase